MDNGESRYEETTLIALLAEDSEYAFQLLYDRHRNRIYQTALRYLKSPILGQEVVQDVFLKLWFHRRELKTDQPLEAWLYTIARNNIFNRLKKISIEWQAMREVGSSAQTVIDNAGYKLDDWQYSDLLQQAIHKLPEQQRKVFLLARKEQLSYQEIAERLGISALTVKTHMARALESIRSFFAQKGIFLSAFLFLLIL